MESLNIFNSTSLAFHPGTGPFRSYPSRRRRQNRRPVRRQTHSSSSLNSTPSKFDFKNPPPNLLANLPNVPFAYSFAQAQCGISLKKRNQYLIDYKKSIQTLTKNTNPVFLSSRPHPFEVFFQEIRTTFRHEHLLRNKFRKLLRLWFEKRYFSRLLNKEDPSTLCEPIQPIRMYDHKSRGVYVFESMALKRQFDSQLGNNKWMFPEPSTPRNPLTNVEFTFAQLLSILLQLKQNTHTSWLIEAFCQVKYNITDFLTIHKVPLKLHALEDIVKHQECEDLAELMEDFMEDEIEHHMMRSKAKRVALLWAFENDYSNPYIRKWHFLYRDYMKKLILFGNQYYAEHIEELDAIHARSRKLLLSPVIVELAQKRLGSIPKSVKPPQPQPLEALSSDPDTESTEHVTILNSRNLTVTIRYSTFLSTIERMMNELVDGADSPNP